MLTTIIKKSESTEAKSKFNSLKIKAGKGNALAFVELIPDIKETRKRMNAEKEFNSLEIEVVKGNAVTLWS
ncbi:MAG: hypothetical protein K6B41_08310 [Butyrivibrio sp.]|nr:hypothetical protein [Butyrivibrio sp.]